MNLLEDQEVITLSEICRVCLVKTNNMKHLLDPNEEMMQIITKLSSISNIEIEINNILPCFLCSNCEEKLKLSYDFQQLCQKSHNFLLACVSASSLSFKVNSFKPLNFEDPLEKSGIQLQQLDNNPNTLINFVEDEGLEKKVLVSYYSLPDVPNLSDNSNSDLLKENLENALSSTKEIDDLDNIKNENVEVIENKVVNENYRKPPEVDKKNKWNQTMRLAQFSREDVDRIINKTREKFLKRVSCIYCGFLAKDSRALSVHMTRLHKEKKEQWCLYCNEHFENIKEHIKADHKDDFKCPFCGKYKMNTGHFLEHLASHSVERNHICRQCGKCFISERHLAVHRKVHAKEEPYRCHVCSKVFVLLKSLKAHLKQHNKHKCKVCEEWFSTSEEYNEHKCFLKKESNVNSDDTVNQEFVIVEINSDGGPNNYCKICHKRVRSLQQHKQIVHIEGADENNKNDLKALCSYCGKRFRSLAKLTVHVRTHTGEAPYKCSFCDRRMATRIHLVVHERTHTGEKPHICKFCGKGFAQSSVLNTHLKQHTGRPWECICCHKRFCRPSELKQHMRTHTGEKPYECTICGQAFAQQSHLVGHRKKHSNERPYNCSYCDKSFKQASSLRSHINSHLGKKRIYNSLQDNYLNKDDVRQEDKLKSDQIHRCEICDQCFTTFEMYSLHYNSEHEPLDGENITKESLIDVSSVEVIDHLPEFT